MNFGVIGLRWGKNYIKNIKELGHNVLIQCSRTISPETEEGDVQIPWTREYINIIRHPNVDTVIIATPPKCHYEMTKCAINHGKNVIVEKPFMETPEQAEEIYHLADKKGVKVWVNYIHLFNPGFVDFKNKVKGCLLKEFWSFSESTGPRRDSDFDVFSDWVSHDLSMIYSIFPNIEFKNEVILYYGGHSPDGNNGLYEISARGTDFYQNILFLIAFNNCQHGDKERSVTAIPHVTDDYIDIYKWKDDFNTNALKIMLDNFIKDDNSIGGQTLDLGLKITNTIDEWKTLIKR